MVGNREILWESETFTDAEGRANEMELILEHRTNDPTIGYDQQPKL